MSNIPSVNHRIQKYILEHLSQQAIARFRDLRPPRVDTNLFTYHLNVLLKQHFIVKSDAGYSLAGIGLRYVDTLNSAKSDLQMQPKIVTMFVVQNGNGDILLQRRHKQPYIDAWTLPSGKIGLDEETVHSAAAQVAHEKIGLANQPMVHAGDCYIRVNSGDEQISVTLAHVFRFDQDAVETTDSLIWARPHKLSRYTLAPAVEDIISRTFFKDPFFFEEFSVQWDPNTTS